MQIKLFAATAAFAAVAAHAQQSVILVRHAELEDAAGTAPKQIALSSAGQARAERLASLLERSGVAAVYATDFARTQRTGEPTAKRSGHEVNVVSQNDASDFVARLRREHANDVVLVVGHTDTLPAIMNALGHPGVKIDKEDFGNVFVVTPRAEGAPGFVVLRY